MGKTYRNNKNNRGYWCGYINIHRENFIKKEIDDNFVRNQRSGVWVDRPQADIDKEYAETFPAYQKELEKYEIAYARNQEEIRIHSEKCANDRDYREKYGKYKPSMYMRKPYFHLSKTMLVPFTETYEEFFERTYEEEARHYDSFYSRGHIRDGKQVETGKSSGFKRHVRRERRRKDKVQLHKVKLDIDAADDMVWYDRKDGKDRIWDFW